MSDRTKLDRRGFLVAAGATAAVTYFPFAGAAAAPPVVGAARPKDLTADWSIDDQWGVYPRYDSIPCVPQHAEDPRLASVHPADLAFLA